MTPNGNELLDWLEELIAEATQERHEWEEGTYEIRDWPEPDVVEGNVRSLTIQINTLQMVRSKILATET